MPVAPVTNTRPGKLADMTPEPSRERVRAAGPFRGVPAARWSIAWRLRGTARRARSLGAESNWSAVVDEDLPYVWRTRPPPEERVTDPTAEQPSDPTPGVARDDRSDPRKEARRPKSRRSGIAIVLAVAFVLPVLLLTVLRTFDIPGGPTDTLVAFTPYAIPCAFLAGLLALLGHARLFALVCAVLFVVHVWWLAPMYLASGPTVRGYSTTVMSVNLQYGNGDADQVVELVRERDVEILAVQELTDQAVEELDAAGLDRMLPHRHLAPSDGTPNGTGIWSKRAVTPTAFGNERRMAFSNLRATVATRGGVEVDLLAVHPFPPLPTTSEQWRRDVGELVRVGVPADRPMIMAGDFNATRDHAPLRQLRSQGLRDAADQAGAGYGPTWGVGAPFPRMFEIDHVLVSDGDIKATELTRHSIENTDHSAVVAELLISEATGQVPG